MTNNSERTYTFLLGHGAGHQGAHWSPLEQQLQAEGHDTIAPDLPSDDPSASFEDDTTALQDALSDHENVVLVLHSRAAELLARLASREPAERFIGAIIINSGGPYGFPLKPITPNTPALSRHSDDYDMALDRAHKTSDGLIKIRQDDARHFYYHDIQDGAVAEEAVRNLRWQRMPDAQPFSAFDLPADVPAFYLLGSADRVVNRTYARQLSVEWLGKQAIEIPTGHSPQLSHPELLAGRIFALVRQAESERTNALYNA